MANKTLLCFGFGLCAAELAKLLPADGWRVIGTHRSARLRFNERTPLPEAVVRRASHVLFSIPPSADGDLARRMHGMALAASPNLRWAGYLSTSGVYGDCRGEWVDESRRPNPQSPPARRRLAAERAWAESFAPTDVAFHIFRLAGIYGLGRSALERCLAGVARRIVAAPNHFLCRIHAEDVAQTLKASISRPRDGAVYNVADDEPAPSAKVVEYACELLGMPPPPARDWRTLAAARRFYEESRRLSNRLIKTELGVHLKHPNYRQGLRALASAIKAEAVSSSSAKSRGRENL